jgi:PAS domain S-box-containing protein
VTKAAALGKTYAQVFHWPEHTPRWLEMERRILQTGESLRDADQELTHADGTRTTRELHKVPFRDDSGEIIGILSVSYDITQRKQSEQRAREQTHLLQTLIDTLPQAVFLKDLQGRYQIVNRAYARAHALTKEEALEARLENLPGGGAQKAVWLDADRQILETGRAVYLEEVPYTKPNGEERWRTLYKFPFWNPVGELVGILGVSEDITERKRDQLALFQAQKLESLGLLAGGVAHDFNNLLTSISGNALLASADLPPDHPSAKSLENVQHATQMAAGLTRQMLAIAGKATLQTQAVDISTLAANIGQLLRAVVPKAVQIRNELARGLRPIVADPSQIQQVVMNLITNAAEAIAGDGEIVIRSGQLSATQEYLADCHFGQNLEEGEFVFLEVSDSGHGMGPETVQRIFEPFYTTKVTGRGLGLAAVTSRLGEGTSFRILFPAGQGEGTAD